MSASRARAVSASRDNDQPDLKVVRRRKNRKLIKRTGARRLAPFTILATIAIVAIVAAVLLEQVVLAQSAFKLSNIREQLSEAEENREVLMLEAAKLDSAARIERYARETLGMVDPAPHQVRYIVADIGTGDRGGAALATQDPYEGANEAGAAAGLNVTP